MKNYFYSFLLIMISNTLAAQDKVEMADVMRSNGKIYVVVAVVAIIFVLISLYLFYTERKVNRIDMALQQLTEEQKISLNNKL